MKPFACPLHSRVVVFFSVSLSPAHSYLYIMLLDFYTLLFLTRIIFVFFFFLFFRFRSVELPNALDRHQRWIGAHHNDQSTTLRRAKNHTARDRVPLWLVIFLLLIYVGITRDTESLRQRRQ